MLTSTPALLLQKRRLTPFWTPSHKNTLASIMLNASDAPSSRNNGPGKFTSSISRSPFLKSILDADLWKREQQEGEERSSWIFWSTTFFNFLTRDGTGYFDKINSSPMNINSTSLHHIKNSRSYADLIQSNSVKSPIQITDQDLNMENINLQKKQTEADPSISNTSQQPVKIRLEELQLTNTRESQPDQADSVLSLRLQNSVEVKRDGVNDSMASVLQEEEYDKLHSSATPVRITAAQVISKTSGISKSSQKRGGSRIIQKIESMKLQEKHKREAGPSLVKNSSQLMFERKSQLMSRKSFKSQLIAHQKTVEETTSEARQHHKKRDKALQRADYLIYPHDAYKQRWDLLITFILVFTCLVVPFRIAFVEEDSTPWVIANHTIDLIFLIDILLTFNTAFYDDNYKLVHSRKAVVVAYLKSWFFFDLLSIAPLDLLLAKDEGLSNIAKLGRMYKLTKLARLIRIMKLFRKQQQSVLGQAQELFKISVGFERLFNFLLSFFLLCHIGGCLWVMMAHIAGDENTWLQSYNDLDTISLYVTSIYFTVTTITTVGYGDISGDSTNLERIYCIFIMVAGVIAFSFATGSLASIIQNYDSKKAKLSESMNVLNKASSDYGLPDDLYIRIKQSLQHNSSGQDFDHLNQFLEDLPQNLKIEISLYIHKNTYKNIYFMKDKSQSLIAWLCPLLKTYMSTPDEYIYYEGDEVSNIFFVKSGGCGFVLPKFENAEYIKVTAGCDFGTEDIIACILKAEDLEGDEWLQLRDNLMRQFTVMADRPTELLLLSITDLKRIQAEFLEAYNKLMDVACQRLEYALMIKLECIQQCELDQKRKPQARQMTLSERIHQFSFKTQISRKKKQNTYLFHPFNLADLDLHEEEEESIIYIPSEEDHIGSAESKRGMPREEPCLSLPNQPRIGEIEEVNPELEQSASSEGFSSDQNEEEKEDGKEKKKVNILSISESSDSSYHFDSDESENEQPKVEKKMSSSTSSAEDSVHLEKQTTVMRRKECFQRLKTIMSKKNKLLSYKEEEDEDNKTRSPLQRLKTRIKKSSKNALVSRTKTLLKRLSDGTHDQALDDMPKKNVQSLLKQKNSKKKLASISEGPISGPPPQEILKMFTEISTQLADLQCIGRENGQRLDSFERKLEDLTPVSAPILKTEPCQPSYQPRLGPTSLAGMKQYLNGLPWFTQFSTQIQTTQSQEDTSSCYARKFMTPLQSQSTPGLQPSTKLPSLQDPDLELNQNESSISDSLSARERRQKLVCKIQSIPILKEVHFVETDPGESEMGSVAEIKITDKDDITNLSSSEDAKLSEEPHEQTTRVVQAPDPEMQQESSTVQGDYEKQSFQCKFDSDRIKMCPTELAGQRILPKLPSLDQTSSSILREQIGNLAQDEEEKSQSVVHQAEDTWLNGTFGEVFQLQLKLNERDSKKQKAKKQRPMTSKPRKVPTQSSPAFEKEGNSESVVIVLTEKGQSELMIPTSSEGDNAQVRMPSKPLYLGEGSELEAVLKKKDPLLKNADIHACVAVAEEEVDSLLDAKIEVEPVRAHLKTRLSPEGGDPLVPEEKPAAKCMKYGPRYSAIFQMDKSYLEQMKQKIKKVQQTKQTPQRTNDL